MKKGLFVLLLAVLAAALFVSCKPDPEPNYVCKVTLTGLTGADAGYNGVFFVKGGEEESDPEDSAFYKMYKDEDCTIIHSKGNDYPFGINFDGSSISTVDLLCCQATFASSPAFEITPVDSYYQTVKFTAGMVLEADGIGDEHVTLQFVKDVELTCTH